MKKPFILDILLIASLGIICVAAMSLSNLANKNRVLNEELKYQKNVIKDLYEENEILQEIVQDRESEITYWGMKYDSIKQLK